jgi:hypothetical protein
MTYSVSTPQLGWVQIANIDAGVLPPSSVSSGTTTTVPSPPLTLGTIVKANDPTYGAGEFILLAGVASTVVGSLVVFDGTTYATTLVPVTANQARPVAVAMAANTSATTFAWYQIEGTAVVVKAPVAVAAKVAVGIGSAGKVGNTGSGKEILGARSANAATVASATTTLNVVINRPHLQGRIT